MELVPTAHQFIPVDTSRVAGINSGSSLVTTADQPYLAKLTNKLDLPVVTTDDQYGVFLWHSPLAHAPDQEYPPILRSFRSVPIDADSQTLAKQMIAEHGPFIPHQRTYYVGDRLNELMAREERVVQFEVPYHQARGFRDTGIFVFMTPKGEVIKFTVCTKGNGTCGYWTKRRKDEMLEALDGKVDAYPLHPDGFHARDRQGQQKGCKNGDDIVWVGCASDIVTKREVDGSNIYDECNIFHPICLPVKQFNELPLATGEFIPTDQFTRAFDPEARLVYLAKAWALETRIWGNHFTHAQMTAAHLLTAKNGDSYLYEDIIQELKISAKSRREKLTKEVDWVMELLTHTDKQHWRKIFGYAGDILAEADIPGSLINPATIIPFILSINMAENVARAGANRLFGKPVAWHLENIGRLGEVSGGERIYGKAKGVPEAMEFHSLFAYMFDAYNATAIEWASSGLNYMPFEQFFQSVKTRILQLNPEHWIFCCANVDQFVSLCQLNYPDYQVSYRSEDAYPLVAVTGATDPECQFENEHGLWKNWTVLKKNMELFMAGIRVAYAQSKV